MGWGILGVSEPGREPGREGWSGACMVGRSVGRSVGRYEGVAGYGCGGWGGGIGTSNTFIFFRQTYRNDKRPYPDIFPSVFLRFLSGFKQIEMRIFAGPYGPLESPGAR